MSDSVKIGETILSVEDISLSFGGVHALKSINFDVNKGELFSIIGPNGAGKTSMLNCISGRYNPQGGEIRYKNHDITNLSPDHRADLGIGRTFQNLALFGHMSALDDLLIPDTGEIRVPSPLSGIFYTASSPFDDPFVSVGDEIDIDQPLCLLEAMKVFTTLNLRSLNKSDHPVFGETTRYRVTRVNVGDGQLVWQNDTLFIAKPVTGAPVAR